tara:strand:- start:74 stop:523 length:450 start_codon:yes stop_codon:yes gene_type:complete
MTVTNDNIRDLLNRPRGLNGATIDEYISMRTEEVNKVARSTEYLADDSANAVTAAQKETAIKALVCMDCLLVLVNTVASFYPQDDQKAVDQRFQVQLKTFKQRSDDLLKMVSGKGGTAFVVDSSNSRLPSSTTESDVIRNSLRETSPYE